MFQGGMKRNLYTPDNDLAGFRPSVFMPEEYKGWEKLKEVLLSGVNGLFKDYSKREKS